VTVFAHVAGVPLEELGPAAVAAGGGSLLLVRGWLAARLRERRSGVVHHGARPREVRGDGAAGPGADVVR
jgi:hypothetical protein